MNIGEAARASGLPAKTIRYYEEINLLVPRRAENGYRAYSREDVHFLAFLHRARALGFSIEECRVLLSLYKDKDRSSSEVKALALHKVADIDSRIAKLTAMKTLLAHLASHCHGDSRPDCPILDSIAGDNDLAAGKTGSVKSR